MRIEKTAEVDGRRLRVVARTQTRKDGRHVCRIRVSEGHYFREITIADAASIGEAVNKAVFMYLGK